jgi:hypothetical protein
MVRQARMQPIHYTIEQIIEILVKHQANVGEDRVGKSENGGAAPLEDAALIQLLQAENVRLRMMLIEALLDKDAFEEALGRE